jgi:hypothetical protein
LLSITSWLTDGKFDSSASLRSPSLMITRLKSTLSRLSALLRELSVLSESVVLNKLYWQMAWSILKDSMSLLRLFSALAMASLCLRQIPLPAGLGQDGTELDEHFGVLDVDGNHLFSGGGVTGHDFKVVD